MRRHFIRIGDKTTVGGTVNQGEESFKHHGIALAYQGAEVYCTACKSVGKIVNTPPYRPMLLRGKQVALENDICACKCNPAPRLLSSQNTAFMSFDSDESARTGFLPDRKFPSNASGQSCAIRFDDCFKIFDASTNRPLAHTEYAILRADGDIEHGVTNGDGHTHLLSSTAESEDVHIYV
ncbi:PAAR domain-containing protein [Burkholderia territorii]|uniref:PAAR domain-containing protein n=1 Tax=Burkholderia territorii TaxID=1503055 RepID=UPI001E5A3EFD|nr:PAAR domain-containing protein [Burkholderia territorii]